MPWVDWFVHTTLGNVLGLLLAAGVATVAGYLKGRAAPLLYGLAGGLLVIGIIAGLACISYLSYASQRVKPLVTPDNVETKIREWTYAFGASVNRASGPDTQGTIFAMDVKPKNCPFLIRVERPKDFPHYVVISASLGLSEEHKALLAKLNEQQVRQLTEELRIEMSRCRVTHQFVNPLRMVYVERRIPITDDLTEDIFMQRLEEIQHDVNLAADTIVLGLERKVRGGEESHN